MAMAATASAVAFFFLEAAGAPAAPGGPSSGESRSAAGRDRFFPFARLASTASKISCGGTLKPVRMLVQRGHGCSRRHLTRTDRTFCLSRCELKLSAQPLQYAGPV